jgi:hypothetical protein
MRSHSFAATLLIFGSSLFVSGCDPGSTPQDSTPAAAGATSEPTEADSSPVDATIAAEPVGSEDDAPLAATVSQPTLDELLDLQLDGVWGKERDPLQDRLARIAEQAELTITIDTNALKDAGFTRNLAQRAQAESATVREALAIIATDNRPPVPEKELCYVIVSESPPHLEITTRAFAQAGERTILELHSPAVEAP